MAQLATLSDAELRLLAQRLGVGPEHVERVSAAVARAVSRLVGANLPSDLLVERVKRATDTAIRRTMEHVTRDLVRQYEAREQGVTGATLERWQSVQDDRVCEDCEARHGSVQTHAEWEADGLPGSRNTVCNGNCRCILVPERAFSGPYERGDVRVEVDFVAGLEAE